ncbi:MAG TPA: tyrosine-type recombinase/integrase [Verrucomicrobiota bacterium]|nr:tyrosine-type recombinase/integrase [Verrucomicrobiota bacterium]
MAELAAAGYSASALHTKRSALRQFLDWRRRRRRHSKETNESEVALFLRRAWPFGPKQRSLAAATLSAFLQHLRRQGLISTPARKPANTSRSLLQEEYAGFLRHEKGLAERSLLAYLPVVPELLRYLTKKHGTASVRRLHGDTLRAFLFERVRGRSSAYVRLLSASLRSFLRFLHARGHIRRDLLAAIPTVRRQAQPDIPKVLSPEEVSRVLAAPNQACGTGRRDYAILLLLARLGLRASEVLLLEVGDIRWRTGEILIRGKGRRQDLLPLPHEVGTALASYLRLDRGVHSTTKRVFLRTYAPRVPLTGPASIGHVVRRAMAQAGVPRPHQTAAHLFRHSLASRMLRHGAHLQDIGEVLRHRAPSSTEIYAKIDLRSLQEVVCPWPVTGGAQ